MTDKTFELWRSLPDVANGGIEVVRARMGACGLKEHFHDRWSLGLIMEGTCRFYSGGNLHLIDKGGLFIIPPYEVHRCSAAADNVVYQILYVTEEVMLNYVPQVAGFIAGSNVRVKNLPACVFQRLLAIDGRAMSRRELGKRFDDLDRLFVKLQPMAGHEEKPHRLQTVLHQRWPQEIDLKDATENTGYSRWYAIRTFQQQVGLAPRVYLRQLRVLKARHLLQQGHSLADVAQMLHFSDQAHFSRVFKSVFGVPPGALQRLMRDQDLSDEKRDNRNQQQACHQTVEPMHAAGGME